MASERGPRASIVVIILSKVDAKDPVVHAELQPLAGSSHNRFCLPSQVLLLLSSSFLIFGSPSICPDHARASYRDGEGANAVPNPGMWFWGDRLCAQPAPVQFLT